MHILRIEGGGMPTIYRALKDIDENGLNLILLFYG